MKEGRVYKKDRVFRKNGETKVSRNRKRNKKSAERKE